MNDEEITIFCPDCRGRFEITREEFRAEEIVDCGLCSAEIFIIATTPTRVRLFTGDDDF